MRVIEIWVTDYIYEIVLNIDFYIFFYFAELIINWMRRQTRSRTLRPTNNQKERERKKEKK